ncbi:hypothetical protein [Streptomyces sp. ITFR-16]|uniref:hypothetical protein n=1 Tax=Streptomyces sp. ITFR-16 TaxID=3075198 RepID=UPI00288BC7F2|nr:hypothetical protein [Streptomyces sp. ITFR-16]WNI24309.1 hypothetical protein RLT58_21440 [Streptomyces sp. ITFR-16]
MSKAAKKYGHLRSAGVLLAAGLAAVGLSACSGEAGPAKGHPSKGHPSASGAAAHSSPGKKSLDDAAKPAKALVDEYTPSGYRTSPVASGYDWANASGQKISESLPGDHLFQIACSGSGAVTVTVSLPKGDSKEQVECGAKARTISFDGKFDAVVSGGTSNSGAYAWRIAGRA